MSIDWLHFTPAASLIGGILIGASVALFALMNGRIAGISGILGGLLRPQMHDSGWRIAFIGGLIAAPMLYRLFSALPPSTIAAGWPMLMLAGVLVGAGTRYGSGCTSGHGVCGMSRFSPRSLIATLSFMLAGFVTVYVVRHLIGA